MTSRLDGMVSVVTGAGQGLGRAFAGRLAAEGSRVVVADLDKDRASAVAAELGDAAVAVQVDVADEASVAAMRDFVLDRFGRIDVLVNNAAVFSTIKMKPFDEISLAEWDQLMGVNVRGMFLCCRAFAATMRQAGHGKIINVSSATFHSPRPSYLHYVTSKAAVVGLTRALAKELGEYGITVNALAPGATETEVPRETVTPAQVPLIIASQSLKRRDPKQPSSAHSRPRWRAAPHWSSPTGCPPSAKPTRSWSSTKARSASAGPTSNCWPQARSTPSCTRPSSPRRRAGNGFPVTSLTPSGRSDR